MIHSNRTTVPARVSGARWTPPRRSSGSARIEALGLGVAMILLAGCASQPTPPVPAAQPPAAGVASPADGIGPRERIAFFVHDARTGKCDSLAASLDAGVPVDSVDAVDQTALIAAASKNHIECARILLDRGADPNRADPAGWTPVIHATYFGASPEFIELLAARGANVNAQNTRGVTALYLAAAGGHEASVAQLLALGADPNLATHTGTTPAKVAQIKGLSRIADVLNAVSRRLLAEQTATP
ncbi:MAG: ankyrin repeat domain-containing protein [Panacagrimonas sp.]